MQNFWCRIFLLPSKVVKKVNKLCSSFLWKGHEFSAKGVKVGWDKVCYPKVEGGLGLKNLSVWNKVCMMRCLYLILIKAGSLWMAWSEPYVLKGANIWQVQYLPKLPTKTRTLNWGGQIDTLCWFVGIEDEFRDRGEEWKIAWEVIKANSNFAVFSWLN
ncbi:hypothetical protein ES332_A09G241900v1 [Gossypium tomentosum]|uniref:Reverse transcriptase zinc-binding domain-containing protein n=1 Tax=Gossypium tomentosum TaxID=34277 RepID=A0A5D2P7W7_GOSTO|nr:hypothetical protein ES332_A09G241900v1 [Gossypium tomentosum]